MFDQQSSTGSVVNGNTLTVIFHFDLDNALFFPNITDASAAPEATLMGALTLTSMFAENVTGGAPDPTIKATAEVLISEQSCSAPLPGAVPVSADGGGSGGASPDAGTASDGGVATDGGGAAGNGLTPPQGCTPDLAIVETDSTGQACSHGPCVVPDWLSDAGSQWGYKSYDSAGKTCMAYCMGQYCPDFPGAWRFSYCFVCPP